MKKLLALILVGLLLSPSVAFAITGTLADSHSIGSYTDTFFLADLQTDEGSAAWSLGEVDNQGTYTVLDFAFFPAPAEVRYVGEFSITTGAGESVVPGPGAGTLSFNVAGGGTADIYLYLAPTADGVVGTDPAHFTADSGAGVLVGTTATTSIDVGPFLPAIGPNSSDFIGIAFIGQGSTVNSTTPFTGGSTGLTISNLALTFNNPPSIDTYSAASGGVFSAATPLLTLAVSATTSDTEDLPPALSYTLNSGNAGSTSAGPPGTIAETVTLAQAAALGLSDPFATANLNLTVTDSGGLTDNDSLVLSYADAPTTATISVTNGGLQIDATINDDDLAVADATAGFSETIFADFVDLSLLGPLQLNNVTSESNNDISLTLLQAELDAILADDGTIQLELFDPDNPNAQSQFIDIDLAASQVIPEPATLAMWAMLGLCLGGYFWRRKRA